MAYWIFKCNPLIYRVKDRLADPEDKITWITTRYRDVIQAGDTAFIWQTGKDRGLCAVMSINSRPRVMPEIASELPYCISPDTEEAWRVEGRLVRRGACISGERLRQEPGLDELSVFQGYKQGTNYRVTDAQGKILMQMVTSYWS